MFRSRVVLSVFLFIIINVTSCNVQMNTKIHKLGIVVQIPVTTLHSDTVKLTNLLDTIYLFKKKDLKLYKLRPSTNLDTDNKIPFSEKYFIYKENNNYGYLYINPYKNIENYQRKHVDSILPEHAYTKIDMKIDTTKMPFYSKTIFKNGTLLEKYIGIDSSEFSIDSAYYYFNNNNFYDNKMSLSPTLDSIKKMKLYKIRLIQNEKFSSKYKVKFPKREYLFELIKLDYIKDSLVEKLFTKFEQHRN